MELLDAEIPGRRKLWEALSKLSDPQENVINDIIDICNEYRRNNQDTGVGKSMEESIHSRHAQRNSRTSWELLVKKELWGIEFNINTTTAAPVQ